MIRRSVTLSTMHAHLGVKKPDKLVDLRAPPTLSTMHAHLGVKKPDKFVDLRVHVGLQH